ncbi:bifunctional methylenetetrahydrofolate dehydrogenase/methenyltetrahydrofolate cyclohydrolase FolD [Sphingopyxis sp.]|uniref:bifunctional 5,10-methylenetetrahydrofolate dehydrogenase/5,10-methenyltetrahydrofolate cyclohydrolase n=1 Tax=Sphingopyxis sp. TaxID=1908224 RepID=UPI002D78DAEB|nr:bifunctional methylenetetrahydrofolate dehydrogenase/methenyltetrahydrofolate cyclohydrolase FolD [Sphingopyxis sp.]HET6522879.1 bifunctional methylenetetrahydrofolate dehydrogenase/methenyltetrahydrofolate cyclohydrolase FolD [Sphingopyxis sp.]
MQVIDGKTMAAQLLAGVTEKVNSYRLSTGTVPGLAVVLVGTDPASEVYVSRKVIQTKQVGMHSFEYRLSSSISETELLDLIQELNAKPDVHGILVQLPLPAQVDAAKILDAISPQKDVDGFHPVNVGRLSSGGGSTALVPCTPLGCMMLLESVVADFRGLNAVVIGKSNIVGKPIALLLLERGCTVTITHRHTRDLKDIVSGADIVVAAAGSAQLVRGDWVRAGAVVIDVGINRVAGQDGKARIVGDVAITEMSHAKAITPVPGGVGPMTIACLLSNTMKAAAHLA